MGLPDLDEVEPRVAQSVRKILEWDGPGSVEDVFCLSFEVESDVFGETRKTPLKPNGGEIPVTESNRAEFARLYAAWRLEGAIEAPFEALQRGFFMMCNGRALELLRRAALYPRAYPRLPDATRCYPAHTRHIHLAHAPPCAASRRLE